MNRTKFNIFASKLHTANPRISPLEAYLFLIFLDRGLFEGGLIRGGGLMKLL